MLKMVDVSVRFNEFQALKNINLEFHKNEITCILGLNGTGKSTLLHTIMNMVEYKGDIFFKEQSIKSITPFNLAKNIGLLSQINNSGFSYTVRQMVMMGRYVHQKKSIFNQTTKEDIEIVDMCMEKTKISDLQNKNMNTLSGGQQQRVLLATVFAQQPKVILLDEPTNFLDFPFQIQLMELIEEWSKEAENTVIAVLHDINLAFNFANRIVLLDKGEIFYQCKKENLDIEQINKIYNFEIQKFMVKSLKNWER